MQIFIHGKKNKYLNILLSISLFGIMWFVMIFLLTTSGDIQNYPFLYNKGLPLYYLILPSFFLYLKGSIDYRQSQFRIGHLWHIVPVLPALASIIPYNLLNADQQRQVVMEMVSDMKLLFNPNPYIVSNWHWIFLPTLACIYCIFIFTNIRKSQKSSNLPQKAVIWLYIYTAVLTLVFLCMLSATLKAQFDVNGPLRVFREGKFVFLGCLCIFILSLLFTISPEFMLGIENRSANLPGFKESFPSGQPASNEHFETKETGKFIPADNENGEIAPQEKANDRKNDTPIKIIDPVLVNKVETLMKQQEIFRQSGLTISELSSYCDVPNHKLSELFNIYYKRSFNAYINHLRIEYVKQRLAEGDWKRFTLEAISLDAGFVTRNTFIVTFKKITGCTPSAYISGLKQQNT